MLEMEEKEKSFDPEFQIAIVAAMLRDGSAAPLYVARLEDTLFDNKFIKRVFKKVKEFILSFRLPPREWELRAWFEEIGGLTVEEEELIEKLFSMEVNIEFVRNRVSAYTRWRQVGEVLGRSIELYSDGKVTEIEHLFRTVTLATADVDMGSDLIEDVEARVFARSQGSHVLEPVATLIRTIDVPLRGGLSKGELMIVAGPPESGKSFLLANIARGCCLAGNRCFYATFENSQARTEDRFDAMFAGVDKDKLRDNGEQIITVMKRLGQITKGKIRIKKFPYLGATVSDIKAYMLLLESAYGFVTDVLFVDYGDIVKPTRARGELRTELEETFGHLRELGDELKIPVVTASQASKSARSGEYVTMEQLAESYGKAKLADVIITISRTPEEKARGEMRIMYAKAREYESGRQYLLYTNMLQQSITEPDNAPFTVYGPAVTARTETPQ